MRLSFGIFWRVLANIGGNTITAQDVFYAN